MDLGGAELCTGVNRQCRGCNVYAGPAQSDTEKKRKQKSGKPIPAYIFTTMPGVRPKSSLPRPEKQFSFENAYQRIRPTNPRPGEDL